MNLHTVRILSLAGTLTLVSTAVVDACPMPTPRPGEPAYVRKDRPYLNSQIDKWRGYIETSVSKLQRWTGPIALVTNVSPVKYLWDQAQGLKDWLAANEKTDSGGHVGYKLATDSQGGVWTVELFSLSSFDPQYYPESCRNSTGLDPSKDCGFLHAIIYSPSCEWRGYAEVHKGLWSGNYQSRVFGGSSFSYAMPLVNALLLRNNLQTTCSASANSGFAAQLELGGPQAGQFMWVNRDSSSGVNVTCTSSMVRTAARTFGPFSWTDETRANGFTSMHFVDSRTIPGNSNGYKYWQLWDSVDCMGECGYGCTDPAERKRIWQPACQQHDQAVKDTLVQGWGFGAWLKDSTMTALDNAALADGMLRRWCANLGVQGSQTVSPADCYNILSASTWSTSTPNDIPAAAKRLYATNSLPFPTF